MLIDEFRQLLNSFSDTEILFEGNRIVTSINGDIVEIDISTEHGEVFVNEAGAKCPASKWILNRLARLDLLATRLLEKIPPTEPFIAPRACILPTLEQAPKEQVLTTYEAISEAQKLVDSRSQLETMVFYVISGAGEGKTSLINELTRQQAQKYLDKASDWILVPIPLGGRHFLRFDDITVGALQNRYRFPFLYYDTFISLVKLGAIVPAFDGFEEMFVENASGEALTALGILLQSLESKGAVFLSTRKAYFDFENLKNSEKFIDSIQGIYVGFAKLELMRWSRDQFIEYGNRRNIINISDIYHTMTERLGADHSLLTRPVLVKKLMDLASDSGSLAMLMEQINNSQSMYFSIFIRSILQREAAEKWIDRSGKEDVGVPLLSVDEHCALLSEISLSMWENRVDFIKIDALDVVVDFFCDSISKNSSQAQQIRERMHGGHALFGVSQNAAKALEFDHDDFRLYFLGGATYNQLFPISSQSKPNAMNIFRRGMLPRQAQHALLDKIRQSTEGIAIHDIINFFSDIAKSDSKMSYVHENSTDLIIRLANKNNLDNIIFDDFHFTENSLRDRALENITFSKCEFSPTSLELSNLSLCLFKKCRFNQIRLYSSTEISDTKIENCIIDELILDNGNRCFDPIEILSELTQRGFSVQESTGTTINHPQTSSIDIEIEDIDKVIRHYMRSTHITENIILMKLGPRGKQFVSNTLPELERKGMIVQTLYSGSGTQRRYKLGMPIQKIRQALDACGGSFGSFLSKL